MPLMTIEQLTEALLDTLAEFEAQHLAAQAAYHQHQVIDRGLTEVKLQLIEQIANEQEEGGKPKFSNEQRRAAELQRRMREQLAGVLEMHQAAEQHKRETAAEVERSYQALRTYQIAAELLQSHHALEAARLNASAITGFLTPAPAPLEPLTTFVV